MIPKNWISIGTRLVFWLSRFGCCLKPVGFNMTYLAGLFSSRSKVIYALLSNLKNATGSLGRRGLGSVNLKLLHVLQSLSEKFLNMSVFSKCSSVSDMKIKPSPIGQAPVLLTNVVLIEIFSIEILSLSMCWKVISGFGQLLPNILSLSTINRFAMFWKL